METESVTYRPEVDSRQTLIPVSNSSGKSGFMGPTTPPYHFPHIPDSKVAYTKQTTLV